ncbi:hypothetical protein VRK_08070 [Vibrio sp. MEBiC08052]|nr:hypothetical protein VRK_08070 [Vibrio sp. MEBiC08052]
MRLVDATRLNFSNAMTWGWLMKSQRIGNEELVIAVIKRARHGRALLSHTQAQNIT